MTPAGACVCVCVLVCFNVSWGWGCLNEQILAPAVTASISPITFILRHTLSSVGPSFAVITLFLVVQRDGNRDRG